MNRSVKFWILVGLTAIFTGCNGKPAGKVGTPSAIPLPAAYQTLAKQVAFDFKSTPEEFQFQRSPQEGIAELRGYIAELDGIKTDDVEISSLKNRSLSVFKDLLLRSERIQSLPKPSASWHKVALSVAGLLCTAYTRDPKWLAIGTSTAIDLSNDADALANETQSLLVALDGVDASGTLNSCTKNGSGNPAARSSSHVTAASSKSTVRGKS